MICRFIKRVVGTVLWEIIEVVPVRLPTGWAARIFGWMIGARGFRIEKSGSSKVVMHKVPKGRAKGESNGM